MICQLDGRPFSSSSCEVHVFDFFPKTFFPKFELPSLGCGLSASATYLPVFTVSIFFTFLYTKRSFLEILPNFNLLQTLELALLDVYFRDVMATVNIPCSKVKNLRK